MLRLAPQTLQVQAGVSLRLRLSWRHPRAWRELRTIALRLTHDGRRIGTIAVRPRGEHISADGAVTLVRRATRLTHAGRTVSARLALRLDATVAGQTLTAEAQATDTRGRRQLEPDAATIRVLQ